MSMVRTRFAPSPTGYLHVGSARTALYCWLYARKMQGKFILRIEDTDRERSTPESVQAILEGLAWLQLSADEGPFYQTQRFERYGEVIEQLLASGDAYRCYCSKERLDQLREAQTAAKIKPRYDGLCRDQNILSDAPYVVRFKNPTEGKVEFHDLVRGLLSFANEELDDLIIARSDGTPTYNFTVVVDDWDMNVTHVIRGDDHINNTPRQINILRALKAQLPYYAHLPMILGSDGKRLSKRHGAVSVLQYREEGFLPEALLNYLVRLGWSHGNQEIFSLNEMITYFDIKGINNAPASFNPEKLLWLNQQYIKNSDPNRVAQELAWHMQQINLDVSQGPALADIVVAQAERTKTLREMAERSRYFYEDISHDLAMKSYFSAEMIQVLGRLQEAFIAQKEWNRAALHTIIEHCAAEAQLKLGKIAQPLRVAITGGTVSPPIDITLYLLGRERVIDRLNRALQFFAADPHDHVDKATGDS